MFQVVSPTRVDVDNPVIIHRVDYVFDDGETKAQIPSTILDCTTSEFKILREGAISLEEIQKVLHKNNFCEILRIIFWKLSIMRVSGERDGV